jgi:hypothetical protein
VAIYNGNYFERKVRTQAKNGSVEQSGDMSCLFDTVPIDIGENGGVRRHRWLPVLIWAIFGAGLLVQAFGLHLKIRNNTFVIPPSLISEGKDIRPAEIIAYERNKQLVSGMLTVGGALGISLYYRKVPVSSLSVAVSNTSAWSDPSFPWIHTIRGQNTKRNKIERNKMTCHKISRQVIPLIAVLVTTLTSTMALDPPPPISGPVSVPNEATFPYSLGANGNSAPIFVPVAFQPVQVMGVQNAIGVRGVGQVTLLRVPGSFLEWVGLESPSAAAITSGFSGTVGKHIVFIDFAHQVDIQVASPDSFRIHNASGGTRFGNVTLIW